MPENPQDADWIYCELTGKKRGELATVKRVKIGVVKRANEYADRLIAGEPLDYILGNSEFCGIKIKVDGRVLIPRFETEVLANAAVEFLKDKSDASALDLCTGSGCIAAVMARNTTAQVTAADVSADALEVAKSNLGGLGVTLVQSDMFDGVDGEFDLIVSNPPYVRTFDIDGLQPQVTAQPRLALDGGEDGLRFYKIIAQNAAAHLKAGGAVMVEVGYDQAAAVCALFEKLGKSEIIKDLDGVERIVVCRRAGA